jgi:hypothetical protein
MPTITICTSASFYRQAADVQEQLEAQGFEVIVPKTARKMKETGDFDVDHYKTWFANPGDYGKKAELIRAHFEEIAKGDAVLILNFEKNGKPNYIGGNVLMEMSLAFWLKKPIFILGEAPEDSAYLEEIYGVLPVFLHGNVADFAAEYAKISS